MRKIGVAKIKDAVAKLCIKANISLRADVSSAFKKALKNENNARARKLLNLLINNANVAAKKRMPICQDTGMVTIFLEIGQDVSITGGSLSDALQAGVRQGYRKGLLRKSVVKGPFDRVNTKDNSPAVIHIDIVPGNKIRITALPKGFGCENKSQLKMFNPTAGLDEIKRFIIDAVKTAGPDACPPYIVGVGIGGTADYSMYMAKRALLKPIIRNTQYDIRYTQYDIRTMEESLLKLINKSNIGPMGLGGKTTCLGVNIETYPTHIAGLPVAVNISCHALRSAQMLI